MFAQDFREEKPYLKSHFKLTISLIKLDFRLLDEFW